MTFPLIGLHAWLGEFAALMFVWAFIELFSGADSNIRRAKLAILLGVVFLFAARCWAPSRSSFSTCF